MGIFETVWRSFGKNPASPSPLVPTVPEGRQCKVDTEAWWRVMCSQAVGGSFDFVFKDRNYNTEISLTSSLSGFENLKDLALIIQTLLVADFLRKYVITVFVKIIF